MLSTPLAFGNGSSISIWGEEISLVPGNAWQGLEAGVGEETEGTTWEYACNDLRGEQVPQRGEWESGDGGHTLWDPISQAGWTRKPETGQRSSSWPAQGVYRIVQMCVRPSEPSPLYPTSPPDGGPCLLPSGKTSGVETGRAMKGTELHSGVREAWDRILPL